jgi:plasmid replication initiation protein
MMPSEHRKKKLKELEAQKIKPHQKISNTFIENTVAKNNASAIKTLFYLASILEKIDPDKVKDDKLVGLIISTRHMLQYTEMTMPEIKRNIKAMQETSITFIDEKEDTIEGMSLLPRYKIIHGKSKIEIDLYGRIAKMIIDVKSNYTFINTKTLMNLKSKHSLRLLPVLNMIAGFDEDVAKRKRYDLVAINDLFGTKYKRLVDIERKILAPIKEELDQNSELSFLHEINFDNFGKGRPKAINITIDLINNTKKRKKK